jgi:hypothetical protein
MMGQILYCIVFLPYPLFLLSSVNTVTDIATGDIKCLISSQEPWIQKIDFSLEITFGLLSDATSIAKYIESLDGCVL